MSQTQFQKDKIRFTPERYSLRGANGSRPSAYVAQLPGMYAYPKGDDSTSPPSSSSSDSSEQD